MSDDVPGMSKRDLLPLFGQNSSVMPDGELFVGGVGVRELAAMFGTPAYIVDEAAMRHQARRFRDGLAARFPDSEVIWASKSFPCLAAYRLFAAEGLSIDVAGAGELVMALAAGVAPSRIYLHGNAKTTTEITMALEAGVGTVVVDNFDDIDRLEQLATRPQRVLIRVIPGITPQTHESQVTGGDDAKFGLPLDQARVAIDRIRASDLLRLDGLHLHIGSQILQTEPFARAVEAVAALGTFDVYDVGGGLGVRYTLDEQAPTVEEYLDTVAGAARACLPGAGGACARRTDGVTRHVASAPGPSPCRAVASVASPEQLEPEAPMRSLLLLFHERASSPSSSSRFSRTERKPAWQPVRCHRALRPQGRWSK